MLYQAPRPPEETWEEDIVKPVLSDADEKWNRWQSFLEEKFIFRGPELRQRYKRTLKLYKDDMVRLRVLIMESLRHQFLAFLGVSICTGGSQALPLDLVRLIFEYASEIAVAENSDYNVSGYLNRKPIAGPPFEEAKAWFHRRLFDSTIEFPFPHIYQWLFYWFGFNAKNWADRERSTKVGLLILFLKQLMLKGAMFFGYDEAEAKKYLSTPDYATHKGKFMLRLSAYKAAALALTFVNEKADGVTSTFYRFHFIAGFFIPSLLPGQQGAESHKIVIPYPPDGPYSLANYKRLALFYNSCMYGSKGLAHHQVLRHPSYGEKKAAEAAMRKKLGDRAPLYPPQYQIIVSSIYQDDCVKDI